MFITLLGTNSSLVFAVVLSVINLQGTCRKRKSGIAETLIISLNHTNTLCMCTHLDHTHNAWRYCYAWAFYITRMMYHVGGVIQTSTKIIIQKYTGWFLHDFEISLRISRFRSWFHLWLTVISDFNCDFWFQCDLRQQYTIFYLCRTPCYTVCALAATCKYLISRVRSSNKLSCSSLSKSQQKEFGRVNSTLKT